MRRNKNSAQPAGRRIAGRPRLEDSERRDRRIGVPVNEEEENLIDEKARLVHMRKGSFLRHVGLGKQMHRPVPAINYRAYRQLGRLATDFGYALALAEAGENIGIDRKLVERVLSEIRQVGNLLMGVGK